MNLLSIICLTILCSCVATAFGGFIATKFSTYKINLALVLAFSAGILLAMVSTDLLPHSLENISAVTCGLIILLSIGLMLFIEKIGHHHDIDDHDDEYDLHHHHDVYEHVRTKNWVIMAFMMALGVAIHNFPEGLAIGVTSTHEVNSALLLAIMLSIHNIPEGMGMMVPLIQGNVSKVRSYIILMSSGLTCVVGAIIGHVLSNVNALFNGVCFALGAGCMLYVVFFEVVPQLHQGKPNKRYDFAILLGFLLGYFLMNSAPHIH